jgi:putative ABC transport system permease protein
MRLALGSLRRSPLRITLTSLGVAIASGALVSMVGLALGLQAQAEEPFHRMELANRIDVLPSQTHPPKVLDDAALARIVALPGVLLAYPDFRLTGIEVACAGRKSTASAAGMPPEAAQLRFVRDALVAGSFLDGPDSVVLGVRLARDLGFSAPDQAIGRQLTLTARGLAPDGKGAFRSEERRLDVRIVGVWDPPGGRHGFTADALVVAVDLVRSLPGARFESGWERLWSGRGDPATGYGRAIVRVDRPSDLFTVDRQIREMGLQTETLLGRFKELQTGFALMDLLLTAVGTVALVVAGLGIINTLLMAVLERYREIGVYKALGASDGDVRLLFLAEAGLVGLLGGLGGLLLGRVVSWGIEVGVNAVARSKGVDAPLLTFAFPPYLLGGALLFALVVSVVSGVYPASRAARTDPIAALRAE